MTVLAILL